MSDEVVIEYHVKELSDFQLNRIARAMAQQYPVPITAYLSDVFISSECAAGIVFGHNDPGPHEQHADGHICRPRRSTNCEGLAGSGWRLRTAATTCWRRSIEGREERA